MSILSVKTTLENYLRLNLSNITIKWHNTSVYVKNNIMLTPEEVNALEFFVEPKIIPISDDRELMSTGTPFKTEIFFQIDIYNRLNKGTGDVYEAVATLDSLFRESTIGSVVCDRTTTLSAFESGEYQITAYRVHAYLWN